MTNPTQPKNVAGLQADLRAAGAVSQSRERQISAACAALVDLLARPDNPSEVKS